MSLDSMGSITGDSKQQAAQERQHSIGILDDSVNYDSMASNTDDSIDFDSTGNK